VHCRPYGSSKEESTPGGKTHQRTPMSTMQGEDCGAKCEHHIIEHNHREASNWRNHATSRDGARLPHDTRARSVVIQGACDATKRRLREEHLNFALAIAGVISHVYVNMVQKFMHIGEGPPFCCHQCMLWIYANLGTSWLIMYSSGAFFFCRLKWQGTSSHRQDPCVVVPCKMRCWRRDIDKM
jgi:hypothetical protein